MITIAYMTNRLDPKIEWFLDSFHNQARGSYAGFRFVVVDFHHGHESREAWSALKNRILDGGGEWFHVLPKPTVWQGKGRLTSQDYFAASNARNTALCLAPNGHIVYVDDLAVAMPSWFPSVQNASGVEWAVTCGSYQKVKNLAVNNGEIVSMEEFDSGKDIRRQNIKLSGNPLPCHAGWHFGCSVVAPVEAYLSINGWPEVCDGMGYEDCVTGIVLANRGWKFLFDPLMLTIESEELHHANRPFMRYDKGVSPNDKSHALLNTFARAKYFDNFFGPEGIRGLREKVLNGASFPEMGFPEHDWFDGQSLREM